MRMSTLRSKVKLSDLVYKKLDITQINELLALQEEAFFYIDNEEILRRNTIETLSICFVSPSVVLGAYYDNQLIAFSILLYAGNTDESLAKGLDGLNDYEGANMKLIIVRPSFRGNGLQKELMSRLEDYARRNETKFLCATVSPKNNYSLDNMLALGYRIINTTLKYGGLERHILLKTL